MSHSGLLKVPLGYEPHLVFDMGTYSCHSRVIRNQQNLYPRVPTAVVELLQYCGLGSNTGMGFLRERRVAVD